VDAIGVCSICGRGVCNSCSDFVRGKLYCKSDAEKFILKGQTREVQKRGVSITFASVFACLVGAAGMTAGFVLIIIGILGESPQSVTLMGSLQPVLTYFSSLSKTPAQLIIDMGLLILVLGSVDIGAGYYLWRRLKWAGIGSVALSIIAAALVIIYLGTASTAGLIASVYVVTAVVKGAALVVGRKHLKPGPTEAQASPPRNLPPGSPPRDKRPAVNINTHSPAP
jgi:hypothetical protein